MRSNIPKSILLITVLALAAASTQSLSHGAGSPVAQPVVKLQGLDGHFYDVSEMRGNVILISFGATWCPPCSSELAVLEDLKREYASKPVKFFWISIDNPAQASDSKLRAYAKDHKLTIPVLRDPTKTTYLQFSDRVRLPLNVFFSKDGRFDEPVTFGMSSDPEVYKARVRQRLDKLLSSSRSDAD